MVSVYGGVDLKSRASAFRGGSVLAWYGGVELDLSEATFAPQAHLTVYTLFGGIAVVRNATPARARRSRTARA